MRALIALLAVTLFSGCAVKKDFYATGGSRADGTVDMAYDFRQFEKPVVNQQQAQSIAKAKCAVWGYGDAEAFGGMTQNCQQRDGWGTCTAGQITIKYQCLGDLGSGASASSFSAPAAPLATTAPGSMSREQYQQHQLQQLQQQGLPYAEYQQRYREIMGQ